MQGIKISEFDEINTLDDEDVLAVVHEFENKKIKYKNIKGTMDYEQLQNKPNIPSKVSQLVNDLDFATNESVDEKIKNIEPVNLELLATKEELTTKADKNTVNSSIDLLKKSKAEKNHTHNIDDIGNFPTIPTKTSQLLNDSDFATNLSIDNKLASAVIDGTIDLSDYAKKQHIHKVSDVEGLEELTPEAIPRDFILSLQSDTSSENGTLNMSDFATKQELNLKASLRHTHTTNEITGLRELIIEILQSYGLIDLSD